MFDITTSRDFLEKLEADFDDYMKEPESARLALNCAITAYHLHEWVWGDWLKRNYDVQKELCIKGNNNAERRESFLTWIDRACPWFKTIQDLANGAKHFGSASGFKTERVGAPPFMLDEMLAGLDEGSLDRPEPYDPERHGKGYLVIDYGEEAAEHRWHTAASLLEVVIRFWREFFFRYHPDPKTRAEVREWRLL